MPRKQNNKRRKPAFQNAKEEKEEKINSCLYVPDSNFDKFEKWDNSNEWGSGNDTLLVNPSGKVMYTEKDPCVKDVYKIEVDIDDSDILENSKTDLISCSRDDDLLEENTGDHCLNLTMYNSDMAKNVTTTDSKNLRVDINNFAQLDRVDCDKHINSSKILTDSIVAIHSDKVEETIISENVALVETESIKSENKLEISKDDRSETDLEKGLVQNETVLEVSQDLSEAGSDNFENKPYDLSLKSESRNKVNLTVSHVKYEDASKAVDDSLSLENYDVEENDKEATDEKPGEENSGEITTQQQLLLAHLSKIQQNFVSNLLQYQARFLVHYQQLQRQMMSEENSGSDDDASLLPEEKNKDDPCEESPSDSEETSKPAPVFPSSNPTTAHILSNLVPYALYNSLLPNMARSSLSSSFANPILSSLASLSSQQSAEDENEGKSDVDETASPQPPPTSEVVSPHAPSLSSFQHLLSKSNEKVQSQSSDPTSIQKYSILNSLIGSSNQSTTPVTSTTLTKTSENSDENEVGNSSFQFKRKRIAFSAKQYELLQTTFEHNNFPEPGDQQCIARQLKAPYRSIKMWFQNKRANARKKLFPGEKGSGRTATGEKIPGDTDTRFYCDKCPSAFICQKYLNNHLDAHKLYTKSCLQCHVVFTHDCLLNTHTISKCGSKEEKFSKKEAIKAPGIEEGDSEKGGSEGEYDQGRKMNGYHGDASSDDLRENGPGISPSILAHLNSPLPLLTLLQIQKTHAEQSMDKENESPPEQKEELIEPPRLHQADEPDSTKIGLEKESFTGEELKTESGDNLYPENTPVFTKKKIPPLIPSELVKPLVNNAARFAILRQLLTNYQHQRSSDLGDFEDDSAVHDDKASEGAPQNSPHYQPPDPADRLNEAEDTNGLEADFKPKNIPEHLYQLLDNKNGVHRHTNPDEVSVKSENLSSNEELAIEIDSQDPQWAKMVRLKEDPEDVEERRKAAHLYEDKEDANLALTRINTRGPKPKRLRRRTTVFTENQHRVLYLHFTHCNFPDPSMFRILSKLTGLTPHVIKIWFQNERSRQRRQVLNSEGEVPREKKPYKCRDCGVEFAMPAFLVKHCMRHIPTDNVTSQARKCPICMVEFETQKLHSHFMASHNLSIMLEDESTNEENICHLCKEHFSDLSSLSIHKNEHLKDAHYGDPPQCGVCKTTFVNVLCLEAHMATHYKFKWDHTCLKCKMKFYDKILLESHLMSHCLNNSTKHCSSASTDEIHLNNHSQSQYIITLLQKVSGSSKGEEKVAATPPSAYQDTSNPGMEEEDKKEERLVGSNPIPCDGESNPAPAKPTTNVNFKFIPVKFIPISNASQSQKGTVSTLPSSLPPVEGNNGSVVTVLSPSFVKSEDNFSTGVKREWSDTATWKERSEVTPEMETVNMNGSHNPKKKKKEVPNLIPISVSGMLPNLGEEKLVLRSPSLKEPVPDVFPEKGRSSENDMKEGEESRSPETSDSQPLGYTPYGSEYRKRRRTPTHFNSSQRDILEAYYKYDNFPDPSEQLHLSEYLQVPYSVIKTWFQNTRKNHRKHLKESLNFEVGGPFECMDCRVCFVSKQTRSRHIRQHLEQQPFMCQLCQRQFPHQAVHDIHTKMSCFKKCKKKHEQIRQFSTLTRTFKLPEKELSTKMNEAAFPKEKLIPPPEVLRRKRKLSKNSEDSNIKYFKFEFEGVKKEETSLEISDLEPPSPSLIISEISPKSSHDDDEEELAEVDCYKSIPSDTSTELFCCSCNGRFDSIESLNTHQCSKFLPQIVGYTCPECNVTFQSFLSIAEHRQQTSCKKLLPILPAPPQKLGMQKNSLQRLSLNWSELFHLYPAGKQEYKISSEPRVKVKEKVFFSRSSVCFLQVHYKHNNYPSTKEMELMSKRLGMEREKVEFWFQKQRNRERKGHSIEYKPPHHCRECTSVFVHIAALWEHERSIHNPARISIEFMCPVQTCAAKFPNAILLQTHQLEHNVEEEHPRDRVGEKLTLGILPTSLQTNDVRKDAKMLSYSPFVSLLEVHYRENNFPPPAQLTLIAQTLRLNPAKIHLWFKERLKGEHVNPEVLLGATIDKACPANLTFINNGLLTTVNKADTHVCPICTAVFMEAEALTHHQKIHSTNSSLVCWECGDDFSCPLPFETHMLQHNFKVSDGLMSSYKVLAVNSSLEIKYSFVQLQVLYNHFKVNNYPKKEVVKLISRRLKVPMKQVQIWFKHQRISELALSKASCSSSIPPSSWTKSLESERSSGESRVGSDQDKAPEINSNSRTCLESCCLPCGLCYAEFVSSRMLSRHLALHKCGPVFTCSSCSATFLHQMVRDTHSLNHFMNSGNTSDLSATGGNAVRSPSSELGLKARSKVLDRETKVRLRKLIRRKTADLYLLPGIYSRPRSSEEDEKVVPRPCTDDGVKNEGACEVTDGRVALGTTSGMLSTETPAASRFHGDGNDVDYDLDDDDDAKLVIDE